MPVLSISGFGMLVMTAFLALAAVAQLNDPDPVVWTAAYGLPSVLTLWACLTDTGGRMWRVSCVTVLLGLAIFASSVAYPIVRNGSIGTIWTSEEGRESAGLLIVIIWLLILLLLKRTYWLDCVLLAVAVVPPSMWLAYKFNVQQTLSLPEHCEGLL